MAGVKLAVDRCAQASSAWQLATALLRRPEIWGASALSPSLSGDTTSLDALLGARLEGTADDGLQLRVKIGVGAGVLSHLGTPEWRALLGVEVWNHRRKQAPLAGTR